VERGVNLECPGAANSGTSWAVWKYTHNHHGGDPKRREEIEVDAGQGTGLNFYSLFLSSSFDLIFFLTFLRAKTKEARHPPFHFLPGDWEEILRFNAAGGAGCKRGLCILDDEAVRLEGE
jgi:hypothetical protein